MTVMALNPKRLVRFLTGVLFKGKIPVTVQSQAVVGLEGEGARQERLVGSRWCH